MSNRLSSVDVSYLYMEEPTTVMNVGSVLVLRPPETGFDVDALIGHIGRRIAFVPRYRQRLKWVPGRLANPVWVDDTRFDPSNHIFRAGLPQPGTDAQLWDLVARLEARRLDRHRPLWEVYVVEGLADGGIALVTKCHQALIDGVNAVELSHVILDPTEHEQALPPDTWHPDREPSMVELVSGAVAEAVQRPSQVWDTMRSSVVDLRTSSLGTAVGGVLSAVGVVRGAPESPLNGDIGAQRRFATLDTRLEDYRAIRRFHADRGRRNAGATALPGRGVELKDLTVNDVVLATLTGGLREWLLSRGAQLASHTTLRALVPLSVRSPTNGDSTGQGQSPGPSLRADFGSVGISDLEAFLLDLPVREANPVLRLQQIAFQTRVHVEEGRGVPARALAGVGGFGPATVHSMATRLASRASKRVFNLLITNVPGPQRPHYAAGARLERGYPVIPLVQGQGLAIGVTSYDGGVYYGLNADRDTLPDVALLADCIGAALDELRDTVE
ncbi:MAG: WS/DGAT/MGAT family O-acyltransferase [Actinomycetales bacterium]